LDIDYADFLPRFCACILYLRVSSSAVAAGAGVIIIYLCFLSISVVPTFTQAMQPGTGDYVKWFFGLFGGVHSIYVNPVVTFCCVLAPLFQIRNATKLDLFGLICQAIVFAFVALSWVFRVKWFSDMEVPDWPYGFVIWYQTVGWVAVDNAIFAGVQCLLFCAAKYQRRALASNHTLSEEEPLLAPLVG
jgi:hypothetical protein